MYNQLASWMVYGILHDQYGEFFVRRQEGRDSKYESPPDTLEKLAHLSVNDASLADWHLGFHVYLDMLPEYIPMNVAESVLFAGKAIKILRNPRPTVQYQDASSQQQIPKGAQAFPGKFSFQKDSSVKSILIGEELLPQSEADKIEAMLQDLKESSEFHKRSFETVVDSIKATTASHLWQLVVVRADLNGI